jgi:hypothetical protein
MFNRANVNIRHNDAHAQGVCECIASANATGLGLSACTTPVTPSEDSAAVVVGPMDTTVNGRTPLKCVKRAGNNESTTLGLNIQR